MLPRPSSAALRWSWLWLAVALAASFLAFGPWAVPLAAWLAPLFTLRFLRVQPAWRGFARAKRICGSVIASIAGGVIKSGAGLGRDD